MKGQGIINVNFNYFNADFPIIGVIFIRNDKRERSQLIQGTILTLIVFLIGVWLKLISDTTLADYFLVVTTTFIFPILLIALDTYEKMTPKLNFLFHIIVTSLIGVALYLTSFRDITLYCEGNISFTCKLTTLGILVIYLIIIAFGVGIANYDKDKKHLKGKEKLEKIEKENFKLKEENELLKVKLNDEKRSIKNKKVEKITLSIFKVFKVTIYKE